MQKFKFGKKGIIAILASILAILLIFVAFKNQPKGITYDDYEKLLDSNLIIAGVVDDYKVVLTTIGGERYFIIKDAIDTTKLAQKVVVELDTSKPIIDTILIIVLFFCFALFGVFIYKKVKILPSVIKFDRDNKQELQSGNIEVESLISSGAIFPAISNVRFSDVAGINDVKSELSEIVDFLKNPIKYKEFGIKMPKGVLMVGPPGVGKTLIAKAVAGEANVPFFYQSGASFVQIYVGVGAKRVRELFLKAKANAPAIIFIDEIDAVGKGRGNGRSDEREATLNQLLTEMDGFEDNSGIIVIAATNRIEIMDEALLRSGRFDRRIFISLPDFNDRAEILKIYLRDKKTNVNIDEVAKMSVGFSGAALSTLVNEAAINALRQDKDVIEISDFEAMLNKVLLGKKRALSLNSDEKQIQAIYQGAKGLVAYILNFDFDKISLIQNEFIKFERDLKSASFMFANIKVYLAGMAALKITKGEFFSNSSEDLNAARKIALKMVNEYAMNEKFMPNAADEDRILQNAFLEVMALLQSVSDNLEKIALHIANFENIDKQTIREILKNQEEIKNESKDRNFNT